MHFQETISDTLSGISISRKNERTFTCSITVDIGLLPNFVHDYTTGLVYEKAVLSGCEGYTRDEFINAINLLGASLSVNVANSLLTISFTSLDTNAVKLLKIVGTMFTKPTFAPAELVRIKDLLKSELHEEKEDAKLLSVQGFVNSLYKDNNRRFLPDVDTVSKEIDLITKKDLIAYHTRLYKAVWKYTLVAHPELEVATKKTLATWRGSSIKLEATPSSHSFKKLNGRSIKLISVPSKQNIEFSIGGLLPLYLTEKDYYAFLFGLNVLGKWGGFVGRLMSTVREKEGLTYGIYARTETVSTDDYGYWRIMTFFAPDKTMQGLISTLREISLIRKKGITEEEFNRFQTILSTSQTLLQDSILRVAGDIHANQIKGLTLKEIETHKKAFLQVTREEVNEALKKYLDDSQLVIAGAGPIAKVSKEIHALRGIAKTAE